MKGIADGCLTMMHWNSVLMEVPMSAIDELLRANAGTPGHSIGVICPLRRA